MTEGEKDLLGLHNYSGDAYAKAIVASNHATKTTRLEASLAYLLLYLRCSGGPRYSATPMKLFEDKSVQLASAEWQCSSAFTERVFRRRVGRFYTEFRRLGVCPTYFLLSAEDLLKHTDLAKLRLPYDGGPVRKKAIGLLQSASGPSVPTLFAVAYCRLDWRRQWRFNHCRINPGNGPMKNLSIR